MCLCVVYGLLCDGVCFFCRVLCLCVLLCTRCLDAVFVHDCVVMCVGLSLCFCGCVFG